MAHFTRDFPSSKLPNLEKKTIYRIFDTDIFTTKRSFNMGVHGLCLCWIFLILYNWQTGLKSDWLQIRCYTVFFRLCDQFRTTELTFLRLAIFR